MGLEMLMPYLMFGSSMIALGVGLVTLSSVATLRGFIRDEISGAMTGVRKEIESMNDKITSNHDAIAGLDQALAEHIEEAHSV